MKSKNVTIFFLCSLLSVFSIKAQQGKDGAANITTTSTVNIYTPLIANAAAGVTSITVASTAGISVGDLIYIIQMQGALIKDSVYEWGNPNSDVVGDTSFGKIKAYNGAGNNEFAEVTSVSGNIITIDCALKNSYSDTAYPHPGNTQVVRVPRYTTLTLSGSGMITCPFWDGHTGGVVVIEVQGNTSIGAGTSINVAGKGFRGGAVLNATGFSVINTGNNYGSASANNGAHKGESVAGDTNVYKKINFNNIYFNSYSENTPLPTCKGNVANGGGGGNANNCGGGGGSNGGVISAWNGMGNADVSTANNIAAWNQESTVPFNGSFRPTTSSGGGRGGYAYSVNNADPTTNGPNSVAVWGSGDGRHNDGGWGGTPLDYTKGGIFLGGGGGAGDSNDGNGTPGGNGGGIVYLLSYGTVTGAGQIIADGAKALNTNTATSTFDEAFAQGDDGAGGGGGGGAVFINSTGNISLTNTLAISAQGGVGGNYVMHNAVNNHNFGPGGGGGGGYVAITNTVTGVNVNGGANGIVAGGSNTSKIATKFPPNGATAGGAGIITPTLTPNFYLTASVSPSHTVCGSSAISMSVTINGTAPTGLSVNWYTVATGGTSVFTGNPYAITAPAAAGTYTYYAGTCPGTYRIPIIVTVTSASGPVLSVSATKTITCSGSNDTLSVSGATSYTWSANAGSVTTNTAIVTPISNTIYTVTGSTTGACAGTSTASISITVNTAPTITITPTSNTLCSGSSDVLTATSTATSYTWSTNAGSAITNSVSVSPSINTTYTVTGISGVCSATQTIAINVTTTPTVSIAFTNTLICNGASATFTASGATTYSWSTGAVTNTVSVSPVSNTTYTVTGYNGTCAAPTQTITVNVNPTPTVNIAASNTAICNGSNTTFTASGATTYSWMPVSGLSSTTNSVVVANPTVTTTYTVTGTSTMCAGTDTMRLTVNPTPSVNVNSTAICAGTTATLTATGASTYTWSPPSGLSATTGSVVTANPPSTTIYTITGTDVNGCSATASSTVSIGTPTITIAPAIICAGTSATLTANGANTYTWTPSTGLSSTIGSTVTATPSVTTSYTVTGNVGTCTATPGITTVTVTPNPTVTVNHLTTICSGTTATLTANGANTYSWTPATGLSSTTATTVIASPTTAITYTVIGTSSGCIGADTSHIIVNPVPTVTVNSSIVCAGTSATLTATGATTYTWSANAGSATTNSVIVSPTSSVTVYTVTGTSVGCTSSPATSTVVITPNPTITVTSGTICVGGTTSLTASGANTYTWASSSTLSSATGGTVTSTPTITTTYTISGTNSVSCTDTTTTTVTVIPATTISVTANPTNTICVGGTTTLTATGATTYTWSPATGLSSTSNSIAVTSPTVTTIYVVLGSIGTCSTVPTTVTVIVNSPPTINTTAASPTVCPGNSTTLTAIGNATSYSWSANAGGILSNSVVVTPLIATTYTVSGTLNNCVLPKTITVNVYTLSPISISSPTNTVCTDSSVTLFASNNLTSYTWSPASSSMSSTNVVTPTVTTTYSVTGQDAFGCHYNTATTMVNVIPCTTYSIVIPNIFSPNGDNINDNFEVTATGINNLTCDIYDRWGLKLYSYNSVNGYWDGTYKGAKEPDGTYFYVILTNDIKGENHKYNGFIQLIR